MPLADLFIGSRPDCSPPRRWQRYGLLRALETSRSFYRPIFAKASETLRRRPPEAVEGGDIWFALDEARPLVCFAGIWTEWTSVRKVKEGKRTNDLYAFLTTEPNAEVGAIHPKAMPVILTRTDEVETWMTAPVEEVLKLQRPLRDGALRIVARGVKEDSAGTGPDQERRNSDTE